MRSRVVIAILLLAAVASYLPGVESLNQQLLDAQFQVLRKFGPRPLTNDVVVVGFNEETGRVLREPMTLWHPHIGKFLEAVAGARAAAVGLDVVLPDRSYDEIVPGHDRKLLSGLLIARRSTPIVLAATVDPAGGTRRIHPAFVAAAGPDALGYALLPVDSDGVVRRFSERFGEDTVPTLAGQVARRLGRPVNAGLIDFASGEAFNYIPLQSVLEWQAAGDRAKLEQAFAGKTILLGGVYRFEDRLRAPVNLAAWDAEAVNVPGVLLHAQALRSLLNEGLIAPVSQWLVVMLCLLMAGFWFVAANQWIAAGAVVGGGIVVGATSTALLSRGWYLPPAAILIALTTAIAARVLYEAALKLRERRRLRRSFNAYVSPQIMRQILGGESAPGLGGERYRLCVLFADIRGFTARTETMSPEAVIQLLSRYFEEVTASIHDAGGTIDKFMGDGVMAFFGAPQRLENPCKPAFDAARDMLQRVTRMNIELAALGEAPIEIGIGLHTGDAVVGNVGSQTRHDYTAIGDTVNVASRLEGLTKDVNFPLVCSATVVECLDDKQGFVKLGRKAIKGHQPVKVCGWRPAATAVETEVLPT